MALQNICLWFKTYMSSDKKVINAPYSLSAQKIMAETT